MAKFKVTVEVTYLNTLTVYADDEDAAKEKAQDIASGWKNVHDANATEAEEE